MGQESTILAATIWCAFFIGWTQALVQLYGSDKRRALTWVSAVGGIALALSLGALFWRAGWMAAVAALTASAALAALGIEFRRFQITVDRTASRESSATAVGEPRIWSHRPRAQFPYSLVDNLSPDQITFPAASDGREVKVDYATCRDKPMRAIWAHPPVAGDTVIRYRVKTRPGGRYLLDFSIGIRDGAHMSPGNQVEFIVRVDGGELFKQRISATKWLPVLPRPGRPFVASGEFMTIELITNALGNNAYNCAVWGEPMLVEALSAQG